MGKNRWIVTPEDEQIDLEVPGIGELWIRVKRRLTAGERKRLESSAYKSVSRTGADDDSQRDELNVDWSALTFNKIDTWVTSWSLSDDDGNPMPKTVDSMRALREDVFKVIEDAVDEHAKEVKDVEGKKSA